MTVPRSIQETGSAQEQTRMEHHRCRSCCWSRREGVWHSGWAHSAAFPQWCEHAPLSSPRLCSFPYRSRPPRPPDVKRLRSSLCLSSYTPFIFLPYIFNCSRKPLGNCTPYLSNCTSNYDRSNMTHCKNLRTRHFSLIHPIARTSMKAISCMICLIARAISPFPILYDAKIKKQVSNQ